MSEIHAHKLPVLLSGIAEGLFYALLVFAPFSHGAVEAWSLSISHLAVYCVILFYFAGCIAGPDHRVFLPGLFYLILALFIWGLVSTAWISIYRQASVDSLLKITDYLLITLFVYNRFGEPVAQRRILWAVAILGVLVAGWGLIRYFAVSNGLLERLANESIGATAPFVNHNHFAGCLELTVCAGAGLFAATWRRIRLEFSVLLGASLVLMFVALLFSLSRGGILSLLTTAGIFSLVVMVRKGGKAAWSPVLMLILFSFGYLWILQTDRVEARLKTLGDERTMETLNSRTTAWRSATEAIEARPLAGYGAGTFAWVYPKFREAGLTMRFYYAHNDYLQTWVEYGLVGISLVLAALSVYLRGLYRLFLKPLDSENYVALGLGAGILALTLHSVADFNLQLHANALLFVSLAALFSRKVQGFGRRRNREPLNVLKFAIPLAAVLCIAGARLSVTDLRADSLGRQALTEAAAGNVLSAAGLYRTAFELLPGRAEYAYSAGQMYALAGVGSETPFFMSEARRYLAAAISLNPNESQYRIQRAFLETADADSLAAERDLENTLAADPQNPACYFYLSDFLLSRGQLERAVSASREGLSIHPGLFGQRVSKIWEKSQAPALLSRLVPDDYNKGHFLLAQHFFTNRLYAEAAAELRLCDDETRWGDAWFTLSGRSFQALELPDSAERNYRIGVEKRPPEMQCYRMLALLLMGQGRDREVTDAFEEGFKKADSWEEGPLRYEYALYLGRKKDYGRMRKEIETALSGDVNNVSYLELLADSYLGERRYYEALRELRHVEALVPVRLNTLRKIASIYEQTGQIERAREYCQKILGIAADDSYANNILTRTESGKKNKDTKGI